MKTFVKSILPENSFILNLIIRIYNYRLWHPAEWKFDILKKYSDYNENVSFIQIGSNNGVSADPIHHLIIENNWSGILIEPVSYLYDELKKNYNSIRNRLVFENCAIATECGELKFYRLRKSESPGLPFWYDQLGSFNKEVVMQHRDSIPAFDELFMEDKVRAITFNHLIQKHSVKNINLVQIDTEGYDYEILKMIPFASLDIDLVMFENRHLSDKDYKSAIKLLKQNDFVVGNLYKDTIAVNKYVLSHIKPSAKFIRPDHKGSLLTRLVPAKI